jgi:hypothetical protein
MTVRTAPDLVHQVHVPPATEVRSTLLTSAIAALRDAGLVERYAAALPSEWRDRLLSLAAGVWVPIEYAEVHYRTGECMNLPSHQILGLGQGVARHTEKTILAFLLRAATGAGATPATVLSSTPRLWTRCFKGGGVALRMTGPKDMVFETKGVPMARYAYFRIGYRGLLTQLMVPFCTKVYMREMPEATRDTSVTYAVSWA